MHWWTGGCVKLFAARKARPSRSDDDWIAYKGFQKRTLSILGTLSLKLNRISPREEKHNEQGILKLQLTTYLWCDNSYSHVTMKLQFYQQNVNVQLIILLVLITVNAKNTDYNLNQSVLNLETILFNKQ